VATAGTAAKQVARSATEEREVNQSINQNPHKATHGKGEADPSATSRVGEGGEGGRRGGGGGDTAAGVTGSTVPFA